MPLVAGDGTGTPGVGAGRPANRKAWEAKGVGAAHRSC